MQYKLFTSVCVMLVEGRPLGRETGSRTDQMKRIENDSLTPSTLYTTRRYWARVKWICRFLVNADYPTRCPLNGAWWRTIESIAALIYRSSRCARAPSANFGFATTNDNKNGLCVYISRFLCIKWISFRASEAHPSWKTATGH